MSIFSDVIENSPHRAWFIHDFQDGSMKNFLSGASRENRWIVHEIDLSQLCLVAMDGSVTPNWSKAADLVASEILVGVRATPVGYKLLIFASGTVVGMPVALIDLIASRGAKAADACIICTNLQTNNEIDYIYQNGIQMTMLDICG